MVTIRHNGQNYSVYFSNAAASRLAKTGFEEADIVRCTILNSDLQPVAIGRAIKAPQDVPDVLVGYELALSRALQQLTPDKALRAKFWEAFFASVAADKAREEKLAAQLLVSSAPELLEAVVTARRTRTAAEQQELEKAQADLAEARRLSSVYCREGGPCSVCKKLRSRVAQLEAIAA